MLNGRQLKDMSMDEIEEIVNDVDRAEMDLPVGFDYSEQEVIVALACCAAGIISCLKEGDPKGMSESIKMIEAFLDKAKNEWGRKWVRDTLYLPTLQTSVDKHEQAQKVANDSV